jgi:hypothetical protein
MSDACLMLVLLMVQLTQNMIKTALVLYLIVTILIVFINESRKTLKRLKSLFANTRKFTHVFTHKHML